MWGYGYGGYGYGGYGCGLGYGGWYWNVITSLLC